MKEIISIIKDQILENIECLNGFSIFKYDDEYYDIYIPTNTILNYYYFRYDSNNFFDSNSNKINLNQISDCIYPTEDIVEMNYSKILKYTEIYIQEHEMLDYGSYKSPIETEDETFVNNGYEAFENQDYQQAYNYYNKAIQLNPFTGSNYTRRASCFVKSGQFQEAINDISRGALTNPISKQNIFTFTYEELGNISKLSKDYKNAIKYYTTYLNNSNDYWVIKKRAECYTQINDFDSAINDLKTALIADNDIELICNLGETYLKSGDLKTATNYLEKVINFPNAGDEEWMREMNETLNRPIKDKARKLLMNTK